MSAPLYTAYNATLRWAAAVLVIWGAAAFAQTGPFQPGANNVTNQAWTASAVVVGTSFSVSRALYNGASSACSITATMNNGASVTFTNVQPGEILPIQATSVSSSSCTGIVALQ